MAHKSPLRRDKTCLNCNHVVSQRFCPNCGQENTDTRKTFHHLFVHFFEDLTHYENAFWKTIKNLLLKPASLTKEYLSGKRLSYLAPIRLYIFISFVTFFIIAIMPEDKEDNSNFNVVGKEDKTTKSDKNKYFSYNDSVKKQAETDLKTADTLAQNDTLSEEVMRIEELKKQGVLQPNEADTIKKLIQLGKKEKDTLKNNNRLFSSEYETVAQLDSVRKADPESMPYIKYWLEKKSIQVSEGKTSKEVKEKFLESFFKNIPKALFIYMPLFAFVLWIFQDKKRWYYFDHGIFTLHYFSFLLLASLIMELYSFFLGLIGDYWPIEALIGVLDFAIVCYMLYYFFPAHHRFYEESRATTIVKGIIIFFINMFILSFILIGIALFSFVNIH